MPRRESTPKPRAFAADNANTAPTMIRLDPELIAGLDAWVEKLNEGGTGPKWSRADVMRATLARGVKERGGKGQTP